MLLTKGMSRHAQHTELWWKGAQQSPGCMHAMFPLLGPPYTELWWKGAQQSPGCMHAMFPLLGPPYTAPLHKCHCLFFGFLVLAAGRPSAQTCQSVCAQAQVNTSWIPWLASEAGLRVKCWRAVSGRNVMQLIITTLCFVGGQVHDVVAVVWEPVFSFVV